MVDNTTLLVIIAMGMCPVSLILGLAIGAIGWKVLTAKREPVLRSVTSMKGYDLLRVMESQAELGWSVKAVIQDANLSDRVQIIFEKVL